MDKKEAFERVGVRTDQEMADLLGITRQAVSAWDRSQIPDRWRLVILYELPNEIPRETGAPAGG